MERRRSAAPDRFRLSTLGAIELTGPDPAAAARVIAQPKRLALLAFLAARPSGQPVTRDRIVVTFWPEAPTARARTGLRNALYFLRGALGSGSILGQGDLVWIPTERLSCDAADLLAGPSAEDPSADPEGVAAAAALLELYGGEFLDGLHVSGVPDFERWVDRTRAALRARATELAWRLSERSAAVGEWITAAGYARRAADLAVDVEGATQRLIRLLDRAGDRAAAIAAYEQLEARLRHEFDASPSPETTALIEEVRTRNTTRARRARTSTDAPGRGDRFRSLAVLPFGGQGDAGAATLADGLVDDLLTVLARLREVRVVSRTSVERLAADGPASVRELRDVLAVDLVLEGGVRLHGDRVRVTVQLIDTARDEHLWAETWDRRLTDVFEVQSDVAMRIARALDVELSPREHRRLRDAPTRSIEAYQLYLKGRELWSHRKLDDASRAISLFRRALDIDPDFALAWVGLADAQLVRALIGPGPLADAAGHARAAVEHALALDPSSGEAVATRALIFTFVECDHDSGAREHRRAVELSPGHATAHQWYGQILAAHGLVEEGLFEVDVALDLDLLSPAVNEGKGLALYHAGRLDEAMGMFRRTLDLDPDYWRALLGLAVCHAKRGEVAPAAEAMIRAHEGASDRVDTLPARAAGNATHRAGRAALEGVLEDMEDRADPSALTRVIQVVLLMLLERHERAVAALETARAEGSLGFTLMYAPMLDPLASDPRFRAMMSDARLLLPRWRRIT